VARGGGSLEDLWSFNDEAVVRAAAASDIPLISAVGHETDWTLIDHAADLRAPTPTAAAEFAVPVRAELEMRLAELALRQRRAMGRFLAGRAERLAASARGLPRPVELFAVPRQQLDHAGTRLARSLAVMAASKRQQLAGIAGRLPRPVELIARPRQQLGHVGSRLARSLAVMTHSKRQQLTGVAGRLSISTLTRRLARDRDRLGEIDRRGARAIAHLLATHRQKLTGLGKLFGSLGHKSVLARGFALVRDATGAILATAKSAATAEHLRITFQDGDIAATTISAPDPVRRGRSAGKSARKSKKPRPDQGTLF